MLISGRVVMVTENYCIAVLADGERVKILLKDGRKLLKGGTLAIDTLTKEDTLPKTDDVIFVKYGPSEKGPARLQYWALVEASKK